MKFLQQQVIPTVHLLFFFAFLLLLDLAIAQEASSCVDRKEPWSIGNNNKTRSWCNWAKKQDNTSAACASRNLYADCPVTCNRPCTQAPSVTPSSTGGGGGGQSGSCEIVENKIDELEGRVVNIETNVVNIETNVANIETKVGSMETDIQEILSILKGPTPPPIPIIGQGHSHTCTIDSLGKVRCWGSNQYGQLGVGFDTPYSYTPLLVDLKFDALEISTGFAYTCIIDYLSKVQCWGRNNRGQLGDETTTDSYTPTETKGLDNDVIAIRCGYEHTCIINSLQKVFCWGGNWDGELGVGSNFASSKSPVEVSLTHDAQKISLGWGFTCIIDTLSKLYCWGTHRYGLFGIRNLTEDQNTPVKVILDNDAVEVGVGRKHVCVIDNLSGLWCWGENQYGQLGLGDTSDRNTPTKVPLNVDPTYISLTEKHTCIIDSLQNLWCWGSNWLGNDRSNQLTPTLVYLKNGVVNIHLGVSSMYTCIVDDTNNVWCWGYNDSGELGTGDAAHNFTPTLIAGGI